MAEGTSGSPANAPSNASAQPYHVVLRVRYKGLKMLKIRDFKGRDISELKAMLRKDMEGSSMGLGAALPRKDSIFSEWTVSGRGGSAL